MALTAEGKSEAALGSKSGLQIVRALAAAALMLVAANCFLKYLWWTACYSAWSRIPKLHDQWLAAGSKASFNGWSVIGLEVAGIAVLCTAMRLRFGLRLLASLAIAVAGTALFALLLSWVKQGI